MWQGQWQKKRLRLSERRAHLLSLPVAGVPRSAVCCIYTTLLGGGGAGLGGVPVPAVSGPSTPWRLYLTLFTCLQLCGVLKLSSGVDYISCVLD